MTRWDKQKVWYVTLMSLAEVAWDLGESGCEKTGKGG